jgi:hypothetical protein
MTRDASEHTASKYTPGPWGAEFTGPHATTRDGFWEIAPVGHRGQLEWDREIAATADDNEANARLIAAAPDLLEALRNNIHRFVAMINSGDCGFWDPETEETVIAARAAIAKAEGKS